MAGTTHDSNIWLVVAPRRLTLDESRAEDDRRHSDENVFLSPSQRNDHQYDGYDTANSLRQFTVSAGALDKAML